MECDNFVDVSYGMSYIAKNAFYPGKLLAAAIKLDLRGGTVGRNIVTQNLMPGDFSNVGGYWDTGGADAGYWIGNYADDVAEAEVGDNGLTIAPPT